MIASRSRFSAPRPATPARLADRLAAWPHVERGSVVFLGLAMALYLAVALYVTRGATYSADELTWFSDASRGLNASAILEPHNGHLIATTRLFLLGYLDLLGPEHVVSRLLTFVSVCAVATLLFILLRRRLSGPAALLPSVLILFLGSTPVLLAPNVGVFATATAAGLGALLALERHDVRGDFAACALLLFGVATFSLAVPFVVGAAALIGLSGSDRWRRAWVVAIPLVLYIAWWLWARKFGEDLAVNGPLVIPNFTVRSFAAVVGVMSGLSHDFAGVTQRGVDVGWGRVLAAGVALAFALRVRRVGITPFAAAVGLVLLAYWAAAALGSGKLRVPEEPRYLFSAAVLLILLAAELFRGEVISGRVLLVLAGALVIALPLNLYDLRDTGAQIRLDSSRIKAQMSMVELERNHVDPGYIGAFSLLEPVPVGDILRSVDRFGSFALQPGEVADESASVRADADGTLGRILGLTLTAVPPPARSDCLHQRPTDDAAEIDLPPGGVVLSTRAEASVALRRYGDAPTIELGSTTVGQAERLAIPRDSEDLPWVATITTRRPFSVCPIAAGSAA